MFTHSLIFVCWSFSFVSNAEILEFESSGDTSKSIEGDKSIEKINNDQPIEQYKSPVVNTTYGLIKGYVMEEPGILANVFTRVPYAKPPVGLLRFRYSKPGPYAVVLWAHGGSFTVNGGNMFPSDGIVRNIVSQGIIYITFNYRLGPLGFLSTLNEDLPGNYGLEDQIMALQWIKDNIKKFNGDPNRVTFGGESAGAACASILSLSPRSEGLFQRAIVRSGSSLAPWAVRSTNTDLNSLLLIKWGGCAKHMPDMRLVRICLQKIPVKNLTNIWTIIGNNDLMYIISGKKHREVNYNHPFLAHTYFTPVVDAFRQNMSVIPAYPRDMMEEKKIRIPIMTGVTTGECAAYVSWLFFLKANNIPIDLSDMEYVVPHVIYANSEQVKQAVYSHYVAGFEGAMFNYGKTLIKVASDQNFVSHVVLEAQYYANAGQKVFTYIFDHNKDELDAKHMKQGVYGFGASHGYDMVFLVQSSGALDPIAVPMNWTAADVFMTEFLAKSIANWAKYGDPSVEGLPAYWPPYTKECGKALVFAPNPKIQTFYDEARQFWYNTVPVIDQLTFEKGIKDESSLSLYILIQ